MHRLKTKLRRLVRASEKLKLRKLLLRFADATTARKVHVALVAEGVRSIKGACRGVSVRCMCVSVVRVRPACVAAAAEWLEARTRLTRTRAQSSALWTWSS